MFFFKIYTHCLLEKYDFFQAFEISGKFQDFSTFPPITTLAFQCFICFLILCLSLFLIFLSILFYCSSLSSLLVFCLKYRSSNYIVQLIFLPFQSLPLSVIDSPSWDFYLGFIYSLAKLRFWLFLMWLFNVLLHLFEYNLFDFLIHHLVNLCLLGNMKLERTRLFTKHKSMSFLSFWWWFLSNAFPLFYPLLFSIVNWDIQEVDKISVFLQTSNEGKCGRHLCSFWLCFCVRE